MSRRKWIALVLSAAWLLIAAAAGYVATQQPQFPFTAEHVGVLLFKGGYRGWWISFCDGWQRVDGRWRPVTIDVERQSIRYGYHWPHFHHSDIRPYLRAQGLLGTNEVRKWR